MVGDDRVVPWQRHVALLLAELSDTLHAAERVGAFQGLGVAVVTRVATYAALVTLYARTNRNALSSNPRGVTAWIDFGIKTWI